MNNLYFVLSKLLEDRTGIYHDPPIAPELYHIAEIVIAKNPSQATYIAWKNDSDYNKVCKITDTPKFKCHILKKYIDKGRARIVSNDEEFKQFWELT